MLEKKTKDMSQLEMISIEEFVPKDHLLRKISKAVDFDKIYDFVEDLYCLDNGRPGVDPVVLFKMVLIQHLYGIPSLRKTAEEVHANIYYRWFCGYLLNERTPHFSTLSRNFKHRFNEEVVEEIFFWILSVINGAGYLSPEAVFIDGTHIKANANMKKAVKKAVPEAAKVYEEQLLKEINEDREKHGKKPLKDKNGKDGGNRSDKKTEDPTDDPTKVENAKAKEVTISTTDPECGVFHKGEHKKCFAYAAQTACDKHGYIMDFTLNPGNVHDSVAFDGLYDKLTERFKKIKYAVMDSAYKTPWIAKKVIDDGRIPVLPYKRPMGKDGFFRPYEYVLDEYYNCVICPQNKVLNYSTTNREGNREYKSKGYICKDCPNRAKCTDNAKCEKTVTKHIWLDYLEQVEDIRHTAGMKELYDKRKETIERVFADAKEKHSMRFTYFRGLSQVSKWVRLKFAAMNLKKYAMHRRNSLLVFLLFLTDIGCSQHDLTPYPRRIWGFETD